MTIIKNKLIALFAGTALLFAGVMGYVPGIGCIKCVKAAESPVYEISDDGVFTVSGSGVVTENGVNTYLGTLGKTKYDIREVTFASDSNISEIGLGAFRCCEVLETITIPATVTSIGFRAFAYCKNLKNVYCFSPATNVLDTGDYVFRNVLRMRYINPETNCDAILGTPSEPAPAQGDGKTVYSFLNTWQAPSENMSWLDPYRGNSGWFYGDTAIENIAMTENSVIAQQLSKARGDKLEPSMDKQYDTSRTQFTWHGRRWYEDNWECKTVGAPLVDVACNNTGKFTILGVSDVTARDTKEASFVRSYFPKMTVDHTLGPEYDLGNVTKGAIGREKPAEIQTSSQSGSGNTNDTAAGNAASGGTRSDNTTTGNPNSGDTASGNTTQGNTSSGNSTAGNTASGSNDTSTSSDNRAADATGQNSSEVSDAKKAADDAQKAATEAQKKADEATKAANEAIKAAQEAEYRAKVQSSGEAEKELEKAKEAAKKAEEAQKKAEEEKKKADEQLKKAQEELKAAEDKQKSVGTRQENKEETAASSQGTTITATPKLTAVRKGSIVAVNIKKCKGAKKYKLQIKTEYGFVTIKTTTKPGSFFITGKKGMKLRVVAYNGKNKKKSKVIKVK